VADDVSVIFICLFKKVQKKLKRFFQNFAIFQIIPEVVGIL